ncbi:MAG: YigZ family protein [Bacteroidetes bacterium RIFCSPLOWO2_12_FULL_31_6]|nr:MAG: YigZ family protein [Bacteroidetes bacterium RIFCSPLOWO2_12_FULL_31_6]
MEDVYKTILNQTEGIYKEKGSKFIAIAFPIFSEEEFKEQLKEIKKKYHDARHHCYAYKLGITENEYRTNDDGEPSNSAGAPIFGQIQSFELTNIAIIVVRYFGGIKLGVGGLISAYREATKEALNNAKIIERTVANFYKIEFDYKVMSDIMNLLKKNNIEIVNQVLEETGIIQIRIRQSETKNIINQINKIEGVSLKFLKTI